jgi:hypothetical protein
MQQNVGTVDRIVRTIAGLALIAWGIYTQNWWGAIGLVFLGTALLSWCPAYLPFGINSRK